jgi:lysophospholipase L1-like esterase
MRSLSRATLVLPLVIAVIAAVALVTVRPAASAVDPVRIMPLGDSITGSPGCWRALLWNRLQTTGFTNIDFVGTQPPQGCSVPYDGDSEGHGGALVTAVADQNQLVGWLAATHPHIVLMHFGTNDVWSNISVPVILAAYSKLVDQMRASDPTMRVLVAQIIPMGANACAECPARVTALNAAIPGWAAGKTTTQSPITVVDQWTGFDAATDTVDGVHPNDSGNTKMSNRWYPALSAALSATAPPTTPPTTTPPTTRPPTAPPTTTPPTTAPPTTAPPTAPPTSPAPAGAACTATYRVVGQWPGGFQGEIQVSNSGRVASSSWTVRFQFANQTITQSWSTTLTQAGLTVTATNAAWNGSLAPAASTTFGFIANWTGTNPVPTPTCVAG